MLKRWLTQGTTSPIHAAAESGDVAKAVGSVLRTLETVAWVGGEEGPASHWSELLKVRKLLALGFLPEEVYSETVGT